MYVCIVCIQVTQTHCSTFSFSQVHTQTSILPDLPHITGPCDVIRSNRLVVGDNKCTFYTTQFMPDSFIGTLTSCFGILAYSTFNSSEMPYINMTCNPETIIWHHFDITVNSWRHYTHSLGIQSTICMYVCMLAVCMYISTYISAHLM